VEGRALIRPSGTFSHAAHGRRRFSFTDLCRVRPGKYLKKMSFSLSLTAFEMRREKLISNFEDHPTALLMQPGQRCLPISISRANVECGEIWQIGRTVSSVIFLL